MAVSGGVDSCVLLHLLNHLKEAYGYRLKIIHFNHMTRGRESKEDQKFVESLSQNYGLDIIAGELAGHIKRHSEILITRPFNTERGFAFIS